MVALATPRLRPGRRFNVVIEVRRLAVVHFPDMNERRVEHCSAFCPSAKTSDNNNMLAGVDELLSIGTKVIEVLGHKAEYLVRNCLGALEDARWGPAPTRLVPLNLRIEPLEHARDVLAIERFVAFPNRLHVLLRHGASRWARIIHRES